MKQNHIRKYDNTSYIQHNRETGAEVYGQSVRRRLSLPLGRYAIVFQCWSFWPVLMTLKIIEHQRNTQVFALIVWRP
jgi:hypothetical protein